jgi:hypothetical protein
MLTSRKSLRSWLTLGCCLVSFLTASIAAQAQERQPAAELIALIGKVEIKSPGEAQFRPAKLQDKLYPQDQIRTLADSRAKLFFQDESILVLSDDTTLDIAQFQMDSQGQRQSALLKLVHGAVRFIVQKVATGVPPNFEIQGKTAVMGIRGTDGIFESRSPDRIVFLGGAGVIIVRNLTTGQTLTISPNQWVITTADGKMQTGPVDPAMRQQLLPYFRLAQTFVPGNILNPGPLPPGLLALLQGEGINFGNPLLPQTDQFRNVFNPSAQGAGSFQTPLSAMHGPLIPQK